MSREQLKAFFKSEKIKEIKLEDIVKIKELVESARANGYDVNVEDFKFDDNSKIIILNEEDAIPWKEADSIFGRINDEDAIPWKDSIFDKSDIKLK